jgi:hypothetical protein
MALNYRTCPFCEATCGLEIETDGHEVVSVRGDADDVFSRGFICPKAYPSRRSSAARTASTSDRFGRGSRTRCARRRGGSSWRPSRSWTTSSACGRRSGDRGTAAWC